MYPTILFEGIDGAGKTYALSHVKTLLEANQLPVHVVDSIPYETFMRSHDASWFNLNLTNVKYIEYLSWQVNNYYKNIQPFLGNSIVLIDRYFPSCYAYNDLDVATSPYSQDGIALVLAQVMDIFCTKFWRPDYTFLFDVQDDILFERHKTTNQPVSMTKLQFINKVRENYKMFEEFFGWNIQKVDGNQNIDKIVNHILTTTGITKNVG